VSEEPYSVNLHHAAARLRWLQGKLPVPEIVLLHEQVREGASVTRLVTTALSGVDLTAFNTKSAILKRRMTLELARALKRFHAVDAYDCPFDHSIARELDRLEAHISAQEALSGERLHTARDKLELLRASQPDEQPVLTHGDPCLPNIMVVGHALSGFIDLGEMGHADRCRDLERACWSLGYNYGDGYAELFLEAYGAQAADWAKLGFYREVEGFSRSL
jgi:aminoglycoside 3'-phosphotransferase-2